MTVADTAFGDVRVVAVREDVGATIGVIGHRLRSLLWSTRVSVRIANVLRRRRAVGPVGPLGDHNAPPAGNPTVEDAAAAAAAVVEARRVAAVVEAERVAADAEAVRVAAAVIHGPGCQRKYGGTSFGGKLYCREISPDRQGQQTQECSSPAGETEAVPEQAGRCKSLTPPWPCGWDNGPRSCSTILRTGRNSKRSSSLYKPSTAPGLPN
jgi:hypothetical protein